jgi:hypothetical protein
LQPPMPTRAAPFTTGKELERKMKPMKTLPIAGLTLLLIAGCGQGSSNAPGGESKTLTQNGGAAIGNVSWDITDASGKGIGKGSKQLHVGDVKIETLNKLDGGTGYQKDIPLSQGFLLELSEQGQEDSGQGSGFGLAGKRADGGTLSWEWFVVDKPGHAKKLQEGGELNFKQAKTQNGTEIIQTDFPTDISLRVAKFPGGSILKPEWRIKILKGSSIRWPSLVKGKVVEN